MICEICKGELWVCENHTDKAWPDECDCGGAGQPCECNETAEMPPGSVVTWPVDERH